MIDKVCDLDKCSGCFACYNICPIGAIQMRPGKVGHLFPVISDKCVECGKCINNCPENNPVELLKPAKTLAFWVKDNEEHRSSTSGGAAACFTNYMLENGGIVYGCASLPHGIIEHIRIDNKADAYKLKGSKYGNKDREKIRQFGLRTMPAGCGFSFFSSLSHIFMSGGTVREYGRRARITTDKLSLQVLQP